MTTKNDDERWVQHTSPTVGDPRVTALLEECRPQSCLVGYEPSPSTSVVYRTFYDDALLRTRLGALLRALDDMRSQRDALCSPEVRYDVETPCPACDGAGRRAYPNTATWRRGGLSGQAFRTDVCDKCWGSGEAERPGIDLRALTAERDALRAEVAALRPSARGGGENG